MPVCGWGGAKCTAGPGAAGDADTVHTHELNYHEKAKRGKRTPGRKLKVRTAEERDLMRQVRILDPAEQYLIESRAKAKRQGHNPPTAQQRRMDVKRVQDSVEERKKGNR